MTAELLSQKRGFKTDLYKLTLPQIKSIIEGKSGNAGRAKGLSSKGTRIKLFCLNSKKFTIFGY